MKNGHNGGPPLDDDGTFGRGGFVAQARAMRDHWLVGFGQVVKPCDPDLSRCYSRSEAWQDLIMECRYEAGFVNNKGRKMEIKPGQLLGAVSWLASRWNWTPKTVRGFLDKLENDHMISRDETRTNQGDATQGTQKGRFANVITVCKYEEFQLNDRAKGHVVGQVEGELRAGRGPQYKEEQGNKGTKERTIPDSKSSNTTATRKAKKRHEYTLDFESWWKGYPDRSGMSKLKAFDRWRNLSDDDRALCESTLPIFGREFEKRRAIFPDATVLHAERFISQRRFESLVEAIDQPPDPVDGKSWGWWRGKEQNYKSIGAERWRGALDSAKPNGVWPWWKLGPPPGHDECLVDPLVVEERKLDEIYRGEIEHG